LALKRQIFRISHLLPKSSVGIESYFSRMKLIKSNSRTSLKEETLQSLLLIFQEFEGKEEMLISERLLKVYKETKKALNKRNRAKFQKLKTQKFQNPQV